ncbi:MAG: hypothetical protein ABSA46_14805 [Thermodesulfovibrionales bacterium]
MTFKTDGIEFIERFSVFLFFASLLLYLTLPISDPDFWWHLASGKWIVQNGSLMHNDPFSFPYQFSADPLRKGLILKQFWLSQILFYGIYVIGGFQGIIVMRAAVLTLMFFFIYRLMRQNGAARLLSIVLIYIAAAVIIKEFQYIGDRPQLWTSFFSVFIIYILEALREKKKWAYAALPLLMLLWGNMHGGFVLGDVIILIYIASALLSRSAVKGFYIVCGSSILLSYVNPNGFSTVFLVLALFVQAYREYTQSITETQSIFSHSSLAGIFRSLPYLSSLFLLSIVSFILNIGNLKKTRKEFIFLFLLSCIMGYKAIRFIIFFACIASFVTAVNFKTFLGRISFPRLLSRFEGKLKLAAFLLSVAVTIFFAWDYASSGFELTGLKYDRPYLTDYEEAVNFLKSNGMTGNLFNDYNQGGYLIWGLTPEFKIAIDGRNLYNEVFTIYKTVIDNPFQPISQYDRAPVYKVFLDSFGVDFALISGCDPVSGVPIALVPVLLSDPGWALVYADRYALIFMRDTPVNSLFVHAHRLPSSAAFDNMIAIAEAASLNPHAHMMGEWKRSLAIAYYEKGETEKSYYWINAYLEQMPYNTSALELKRQIEQSLRGK